MKKQNYNFLGLFLLLLGVCGTSVFGKHYVNELLYHVSQILCGIGILVQILTDENPKKKLKEFVILAVLVFAVVSIVVALHL